MTDSTDIAATAACDLPVADTCDHCGAKAQLLCLYGAYVCEDCYEETAIDRGLCDGG